jgi:hypothetical protein
VRLFAFDPPGAWSAQNAYAEINRIEAEIMSEPAGPVLMCLGVTATVLAARLAAKGVHALDLGHIGMFRRHAGAYRFRSADLLSPEYAAMLAHMHQPVLGRRRSQARRRGA